MPFNIGKCEEKRFMKAFKYVDTNSPVEMTVGMFEMLSTDEADVVLEKIQLSVNRKRLGAENFSEVVFNEESSPFAYTEVLSCPRCRSSSIVKNGYGRDHSQRYLCTECTRTFSASSETLSSNTTQDVGK